MTQPAPPFPECRHVTSRFAQALRRYFVTGLATLFPVFVTIQLLVWIFQFTDRYLGRSLGFQIPGLGLVVTALVIFVVGVLSIHFFGRVLFKTIEVWFSRLPLVRKVYPAVKQMADFFFDEEQRQNAFRGVVLVQYPRTGSYAIAFVTNEGKVDLEGRKQTLLTLLVPNPPSPFSGPVLFVPKEEVIPLQMSIEEALKLIVSGGVVAPPLRVTADGSPKPA